jgi:ABC-type multidrug transport system ATPase subunit
MKALSGHLSLFKGSIKYLQGESRQVVEIDSIYRNISFAAPYIELIEEFTLSEMLDFHRKFKSFQNELDNKELLEILGFEKSKNKALRFFSSGMKQRLKLALAICSDSAVLLLDEPTTNLDTQGADWYRNLLQEFSHNRTIVVATNTESDYSFFCKTEVNLFDYK